MKSITTCLLCGICLAMIGFTSAANANHRNVFFAFLDGFNEVPSALTEGAGFFSAKLNQDGAIEFRLRVGKLSAPPLAAHIHFAQKDVNGGVVVTLCGGPPPAVVPVCADDISGVITADFVGNVAAAQGIVAGDMEGALRAMRSGNAYINVHTSTFPGGEVRGQVR